MMEAAPMRRAEERTKQVITPALSTSLEGLTDADAAARLIEYGPNLIREGHRRGFVDILRGMLREPMFPLLLVAAALYLIFGDIGEGIFLLAGACLSLGLVVVQEMRSERALAELNALAEPVARVIRSGRAQTINARDIVPGDLLILGEGARIPADAALIAGDALTVDESALTGEAASVTKCATAVPEGSDDPEPGEAMSGHLFAGTMIVRGQGQALVIRTGGTTRFGRIGAALASVVEQPTLLQRNVSRLIGRLGVLALAFCILVALVYGSLRGDWLAGALTGLTLAISLLPEEFPMVLAVFMALGAWRLAHHNVIVRRSAVIETLGATTLLCVDKTGTLTENRMSVQCVWRDDRVIEPIGATIPPEALELLRTAQLASAVRPNDPMDAAVHQAAGTLPEGEPLRSYPLRPNFLAFVQTWPAGGGSVVYAAKGAPETIIRLCGMTEDRRKGIETAVAALGARGMRVLAVAASHVVDASEHDPSEIPFTFQGLIGFVDPVRSDVPAALEEANRAGVGVAMITGDYPATALAIARSAGIDTAAGVITGAELEDPDGAPERLAGVRVFARIMPDQKLKLIEAFKAAGEVVAMTGDGINDAPALAAAHIGIAMGRRGTDVAREASDLILVDDRFASIVGGIRLGRRIFANLRRAMTFITAIHVPIAGLALVPILLGLPPMLYPMHVVLLELLIDPLCSLVFESERGECDAMTKPPRAPDEPLFGLPQMLLALLQGSILLAGVLGLYWGMIEGGAAEAAARSSAFVALVIGNLSLALAEASSGSRVLFSRERRIFWAIGGAALLVLLACLGIPALAQILGFSIPSPAQLLLAGAVGLMAGGWYAIASFLPSTAPTQHTT
jgi:P-type Ca2+ transporter type 2C